jgi:hypothetical protein
METDAMFEKCPAPITARQLAFMRMIGHQRVINAASV